MICKTKAEWIDDQASQDENFDAFAQSTFDGLDLFRQTAMAAIAEYKAETGAADVDWCCHSGHLSPLASQNSETLRDAVLCF